MPVFAFLLVLAAAAAAASFSEVGVDARRVLRGLESTPLLATADYILVEDAPLDIDPFASDAARATILVRGSEGRSFVEAGGQRRETTREVEGRRIPGAGRFDPAFVFGGSDPFEGGRASAKREDEWTLVLEGPSPSGHARARISTTPIPHLISLEIAHPDGSATRLSWGEHTMVGGQYLPHFHERRTIRSGRIARLEAWVEVDYTVLDAEEWDELSPAPMDEVLRRGDWFGMW